MNFIRNKVLIKVIQFEVCFGIGLNQLIPEFISYMVSRTELARNESQGVKSTFHSPTANQWKNCRAFPIQKQKGGSRLRHSKHQDKIWSKK